MFEMIEWERIVELVFSFICSIDSIFFLKEKFVVVKQLL